MKTIDIMKAIQDACSILWKARCSTQDCTPVVTIVRHAHSYLESQMAELLAE